MIRAPRAFGRFLLVGLATALVLSGMARLVSANLAFSEAPEAAPVTPPGPALDELELLVAQVAERERRLADRAAELAEQEAELAAARAAIDRSLTELAEADAALEARMFASNTASENDLAALTAIYEGMKPKDAATLFETMDPDFAAGFLARMSPDVAAAIFSNLPPLTAYAVSANIAGRNSAAATEPNE